MEPVPGSALLIREEGIILVIPLHYPAKGNKQEPVKRMSLLSTEEYIELIKNAPVYDVARQSPLEPMARLSQRLGCHILLKREDIQPVFSFKLRGAYTKIKSLDPAQRQRGVICASAGNHAQGVALAARQLGLQAVVVMPKTTPEIKVSSTRELGAQIVLHGNTYDEAYQRAVQLMEQKGMVYIPPYDDPLVIAGQGTVGKEILQQIDKLDAIFVPVGGGGLLAGIALWVKAHRPQVRIIGVEPEDAPSMHAALAAGERVELKQIGIFADGVAVRQAGEEPFRLAQQFVDEMILVKTDEICAAIKDIYDDTRSIAEPAGALGVAGIKKYLEQHDASGQTLVAIDSGANMNFDRLRHVAERAELGEQREVVFAATIPEQAGSFRRLCEILGQRGITEFNYRYSDSGDAHVFVGMKTQRGEEEKQEIFQLLRQNAYPFQDMSDNEMAKLHVRYMVGGRVSGLENERLYRFEFPERPGAMQRFLDRMGRHWNISLFHYRNHGAAYGRVLIGIQVPDSENDKLQRFLDELQYPYWEESANPAYALFLS